MLRFTCHLAALALVAGLLGGCGDNQPEQGGPGTSPSESKPTPSPGPGLAAADVKTIDLCAQLRSVPYIWAKVAPPEARITFEKETVHSVGSDGSDIAVCNGVLSSNAQYPPIFTLHNGILDAAQNEGDGVAQGLKVLSETVKDCRLTQREGSYAVYFECDSGRGGSLKVPTPYLDQATVSGALMGATKEILKSF